MTLAAFLIASACILLTSLGTRALLRDSTPALRHAAAAAGILGVLLVPVLGWLLPAVSLRVLPAVSGNATHGSLVSSGGFDWIAVVWLTGVLAGLAHTGAGLIRLAAARRRAIPVVDARLDTLRILAKRIGVRRIPQLVVDPRARTAMTWGILRPVIALPSTCDWPRGRLQAVLIHELAHVRRGDAGMALLTQLACAFAWPNPLVWRVRRHLRVDQEFAADDLALAIGAKASAYASHLLELVRRRCAGADAVPAVAIAGASSHLDGRLRAVLSSGPRAKSTPRLLALSAAVVLAMPPAMVRLDRAVPTGVTHESQPEPNLGRAPSGPSRLVTAGSDRAEQPVVETAVQETPIRPVEAPAKPRRRRPVHRRAVHFSWSAAGGSATAGGFSHSWSSGSANARSSSFSTGNH